MRKFLIVLVLILVLVGCEKTEENTYKEVNNPVNTSSNSQKIIQNYEIKKEDIEEKEFIIDSEVDTDGALDCNLYFISDKVYYYDGFGNTIRGDYTIEKDKLLIKFTGFISDYSPEPQTIDVDVILKMTNENTIEVAETPNSYTVKTSTISGDGWVFDGGEKEMEFLGFVKGYHFYKLPEVAKIDDSKDWVYDADYEKNLKAPSYVVWDKIYSGDAIVVPYININSDYARQANNEIKNTFEKIVSHYNDGVEDGISYVDSCGYTTYGQEKGVFVLFTYGLGATDVVHPVYCTYNFNLIDGSKMDLDYFCNYIGLSKEAVEFSISENIETIIKEKMSDFEEAEIQTYIDLTKADFKKEFESRNAEFTIMEDGEPAFVVDIQIPAGTGHFDTLVKVYE